MNKVQHIQSLENDPFEDITQWNGKDAAPLAIVLEYSDKTWLHQDKLLLYQDNHTQTHNNINLSLYWKVHSGFPVSVTVFGKRNRCPPYKICQPLSIKN